MKLAVQIPAYNEEEFLERAITDIRQSIPVEPFDQVEIVVIDDGSTDNTIQAALRANIQHIVKLEEHGGLGAAFKKGLAYSLDIGADVIVNFDADMQYRAEEIRSLVKPILEQRADMVIGDRQLRSIPKYPLGKRMAQETGNHLISFLYQSDIKDSTSGFRAFSSDCARLLIPRIENVYTYTIESLCHLLGDDQRISFVPINIRDTLRESRLIKNKMFYIQNYLYIVFRCFYQRASESGR